jgi:predicted N-acetyltransferase YhbS
LLGAPQGEAIWVPQGGAGSPVFLPAHVSNQKPGARYWEGPYHPGMDLREEFPGDRESVRDLHVRAFGDHGPSDHGLVVASLVDALRETITPTAGLSLIAEQDGQIVGHVMFTRSLLDAPRRLVEVHVLSPLAVMPDHHRRGIGSALVRRGLKVLADRAVPWSSWRGIRAITHASGLRRVAIWASGSHPCAFRMPPSTPSGSRSTSSG